MTRPRHDFTMDLAEVRRLGLEALARELGPVGLVRFLQQFETGRGDYTAERRQWLPRTDVQSLCRRDPAGPTAW